MTAGPALGELLTTWQQWSERDLIIRAVPEYQAAGDSKTAAVLTGVLADLPVISPVQALAANAELTGLLSGWQWHATRAAREQGAGWEQIAQALGTTARQARADYLTRVERAERHAPAFTDTAAYRAAADDPSKPAGGDLPPEHRR
jgi:hypothetical protein